MSVFRTSVWLTVLSAIGFVVCGLVENPAYYAGLGLSAGFAWLAICAKIADVLGGGAIRAKGVRP